MYRLYKKAFFIVVLSTLLLPLFGQNIESIEFRNQSITDILLVLGETSGNSIVPDETVKGNASYYFSDTDFETALSLFLTSYNYYFIEENGIYYVSLIKVSINKES